MSTSAEAELNALRQLFAQQSQELQKERATSARLRLENEALRASRARPHAAPPDYAEAKTPDGANPAPAAFAIGPPPPRRRTLRADEREAAAPHARPGWAPESWSQGAAPAPVSPIARGPGAQRPPSPPTRPPSPPGPSTSPDAELWRDVESGKRLTPRNVKMAYPQLGEAQVAALATTVVRRPASGGAAAANLTTYLKTDLDALVAARDARDPVWLEVTSGSRVTRGSIRHLYPGLSDADVATLPKAVANKPMGPNQSARQVYTYLRRDVDALAGARLPTVADAGEISPRSPAPKKSRASSKSRASTRGRIRAVDEEGGAKRSGSVLDLLANAAAQTG